MSTLESMQMRRDPAASWTSNNPVPLNGEWCKETDTGLMKIGDGVTAWNLLPYYGLPLPSGTPAIGQGLVIVSASPLTLGYGGAMQVSAVPSPASGLPVGPPGDSTANTGLQLLSSRPTDDITGGTDGTGRLLLYSYQRANTNLFGETIRNFLMHWDAKAMSAWYGPDGLYDGSGNPVGSTWHPWVWTGAHYEADNDASLHCHWELEVPDSTQAMQGRLAVPFGNTTTGDIGLDLTTIYTNLANFHVYCQGTAAATGLYQEQYFRLTAPAGYEKPIEWNNDNLGATASRRWKVVASSDAETGSNVGTNFILFRYSDAGTQLDQPIVINRASGGITLGSTASTAGVTVLKSGGTALTVTQSGATSTGLQVTTADATSTVLYAEVSGDTANRFQMLSTGQMQWGPGSASRDTTLARTAAGILTLTGGLVISGSLTVDGAVTLGSVSGAYLCAPNQYAPGSQTPLTVTTTALAAFSTGVVCTNSFVAPASGSVVVTLSCAALASVAGADMTLALAAVGTVTPVFGKPFTTQLGASTASTQLVLFYVTGLTPGNTYQFDLLGAATSGDTASIYANGASSVISKGAPVLMTVQAV